MQITKAIRLFVTSRRTSVTSRMESVTSRRTSVTSRMESVTPRMESVTSSREFVVLLGVATIATLAISACGSFDNPTIVKDLRFLGAIAEPPEILVPADPDEIVPENLPDIEICALVADPAASRALEYDMVACPKNVRGRCDADAQPQIRLGTGQIDDPEESATPVSVCATLRPTLELAAVIQESVSLDSLAGFGAVDIQVAISVWPTAAPDEIIFATKHVRFGAALPEARVPNENPSLSSIAVSQESLGTEGRSFDLPQSRCSDMDVVIASPGEEFNLLPIEPLEARQDYLVPTLDGEVRQFTENITYRFFASDGRWSDGVTGGTKDIAGNEPTLDSTWTAPDDLALIGAGIDVPIFIIQRDERGGQSWFQSCVRVLPN